LAARRTPFDVKLFHLARRAHAGRHAEKKRVDDGEHGGVGADAERENEDDGRRERGLFAQRARGVAHILLHRIYEKAAMPPAHAPPVAVAAFGDRTVDVAEACEGLASRVFGRDAGGDELFGLRLKVKAELVAQVALGVGAEQLAIAAPGGELWSFHNALRCLRFGGQRRGAEHRGDGGGVALPARRLGAKLLAAAGGELVELGAFALVGEPPLGLDPLALLEAVEGGVEGAVEHLEGAAGGGADHARDGVSVPRAPGEGLEDEDVERALEEVGLWRHVIPSCFEDMVRGISSNVKGMSSARVERSGDRLQDDRAILHLANRAHVALDGGRVDGDLKLLRLIARGADREVILAERAEHMADRHGTGLARRVSLDGTRNGNGKAVDAGRRVGGGNGETHRLGKGARSAEVRAVARTGDERAATGAGANEEGDAIAQRVQHALASLRRSGECYLSRNRRFACGVTKSAPSSRRRSARPGPRAPEQSRRGFQ